MKKTYIVRIIGALLFISLIIIAISWPLRLIFLFFLFLVIRKLLPVSPQKVKIFNISVFAVLLLLFLILFPKRKSDETDYIRSVYFEHTTGEKPMPWVPYLTNIIGEGDVFAFTSLGVKITPKIILYNIPVIKDYKVVKDFMQFTKNHSFGGNAFLSSYRKLQRKGCPPHNVIFQFLQGIGMYRELEHYFLYTPKDKNLSECEVVVFCHGLGGNWLLYSQLFAQHSDAIVICVETRNINGYFSKGRINTILTKIIPHVFKGLDIPAKNCHLIGLSNGGSSVNTAIRYFPNKFKSYTILSATLSEIPQKGKNIHVIYGSNDRSGGVRRNIPASRYKNHLFSGENHMLLVNKTEELFGTINDIINE